MVFAAPVCAPDEAARSDADDVYCLARPDFFRAVGQFYRDFTQTGDREVTALLDAAHRELTRTTP